jgi:hypothetical protein
MTIRRRVACWIGKATCAQVHSRVRTNTHTHTHMRYLLLFHGNNGFVNAPQCYVIRALSVLFVCYNEKENYYDEAAKPVNFRSCTK